MSLQKMRWNSFVKKKKAMVKIDLLEAISVIRSFLNPIVDAIHTGDDFDKIWQSDERRWID